VGVRIGIDIGGTFTDLQILDEASGRVFGLKTPTTPDDPSIGFVQGLHEAARRFGFHAQDVSILLHGTTIATNAVLERRLARGVLLTTEGFRDVLEIGRHGRRDIYGLKPRREPALIPRDRRLEVPERMRADGHVERKVGALDAVMRRIRELGAEAVAIALLHAHINPAHEQQVRDAVLAEFPDLPVSLSSEISPEIREYERTSTTVLNALLMPVIRSYLRRLAARLTERGVSAPLLLVQSNGGVCSPDVAAREPARLLLSGPSGGALAALRAAERIGAANLVGIDMGGTSFDVSVISNHRITLRTEGEIDGLPVRLPMVEIRSIGAGGGSIGAVDGGDRLTVGPRSAGARPGPVCYKLGGSEPTVTDANIALGRLDAGGFLGGAMLLDREAARAAIREKIASPLGLAVDEAAEGMLAVTNTSLAAAIRLSLFEKGLDPRDFSLLSFGGAGGLHATAVADELGIGRVIFPPNASTFSAYGILHSDIVHDLARSRLLVASQGALPDVVAACEDLRRQGKTLLTQDGVAPERQAFEFAVDMRYRGQAFELTVPWSEARLEPESLARLLADFHALHQQGYAYANPSDVVEIVTLRLSAIGRLQRRAEEAATTSAQPCRKAARRKVFIGGASTDIPIHARVDVVQAILGPAVIEEDYTTILLTPGWRCEMRGTDLVATRL
jgi:N-methylhydantoinase A